LLILAFLATPVNADDKLYSLKDWEPSHGRYKKSVRCVETISSWQTVVFSIYNLRILTLSFGANFALEVIDNILFKPSLIRSIDSIINISSTNSFDIRLTILILTPYYDIKVTRYSIILKPIERLFVSIKYLTDDRMNEIERR
jgi:hypothetical protein